MTTSERGPRGSRDEPNASSPPNIAPSRIRPDRQTSSTALEHRLSNVIDVQNPARIIECSHLERQRKFQYLVRRYVLVATSQRALITHANQAAATCHRSSTAVRAPPVIPQRASHAISAVLPSPIDRRPSSPHERLPTTSPAKATLIVGSALMS